jgi:hypothetical protein
MEDDGYYIVGRPHVSGHHPFLHQDVFRTDGGRTARLHQEITLDERWRGQMALGMYDAAQAREQRGR